MIALIVLLIVLGVVMSLFTIDPVLLKMIYALVAIAVLLSILGALGLLDPGTGHFLLK